MVVLLVVACGSATTPAPIAVPATTAVATPVPMWTLLARESRVASKCLVGHRSRRTARRDAL